MSRKRAVAANDIARGTKISKEMILFKRANEGVYANEAVMLIGKKAKSDIKNSEGITLDKVE
jgi:sialic acid synthase SpsE